MKKLLLCTISTIAFFLANAQAWQPCNTSGTSINVGNTYVVVHKNKLFQANNSGLRVSTDNGQTWTVVNNNILYTSQMISTDNRLYVIQSQAGCSDIQYSTDEGITFTPDTTMLPKCWAGAVISPSSSGAANSNRLLLTVAGPDWEFTKSENDIAWTDISYFDPNDPADFTIKNDTLWASTNGSTSNGVAWSTDGVNWTSPACTGITNYYVPAQMVFNGNRMFVNGSDVSTGYGIDTIIMYSDDLGASFQEINIKEYLDSYMFFSFTNKQPIMNMYAGYNHLYFTLGQDAMDSHPELIVSTDNGMTFQKDTVGFSNAAPLLHINSMAFLNGWVFAQLDFGDLYRKQISPTDLSDLTAASPFQISPNPVQDKITVSNKGLVAKIVLTDMLGQQILQTGASDIDVASLPAGMYIVQVFTTDRHIYAHKIIKQ
jgi:hypothetical protein